jgi:hypothetical protein
MLDEFTEWSIHDFSAEARAEFERLLAFLGLIDIAPVPPSTPPTDNQPLVSGTSGTEGPRDA